MREAKHEERVTKKIFVWGIEEKSKAGCEKRHSISEVLILGVW